jgi:hypothetical protein
VSRTLSLSLVSVFAVLGAGCYGYVPTTIEVPPQGEQVRLVVTRVGAAELEQVTDVDGGAPVIDGNLISTEGEDLRLQVPVGRTQLGFHHFGENNVVLFAKVE